MHPNPRHQNHLHARLRGGAESGKDDDLMRTPTWFKVMFAVCALLGLGLMGVIVWGIITLVNWVTSQ